ncbi:MAG: GAF domain-containing protein [Magnetococcales bacterium]|nr:GAF domain-containing protein [Magnetococcales bacterium]
MAQEFQKRDPPIHRFLSNDPMRELRFTQFAVDHASDAMFWIGSDGQFIYVNEGACRSLGYSREELLTLTVMDVDPNATAEVWHRHWQELRERNSFILESCHRTKTGKIIPVEIRANFILFDGLEYNCAFVRDISERKHVETILLKEKEVQAILARLGKDYLAIREISVEEISEKTLQAALDITHSTLGFVNEVDAVTGWSVNRAITRGNFPLCQSHEQPLLFRERRGLFGWVLNHQQPLLTNTPARHEQFSGLPEGHPPIERFLSVPVINRGRLVAQIAVANGGEDYTPDDATALSRVADLFAIALERVYLERQLRHAGKMEAIGTLSAGIAHDFNNILAIILGYVDLAFFHKPSQQVHGYLEEISTAGNRAKDLVDQLLTFSRSGESPQQPLLMAPLVKEVSKFIRASMLPSIELETRFEDDGMTVFGNASQLHQLLMNLCTNARQAILGDRGRITIALERVKNTPDKTGPVPVGDYLLLQVGDSGQGIHPDALEHIFDPFFTTKEVGQGTGLGLSVVHGIVVNHGGKIMVESTSGVGSIFRVYLPLMQDNSAGSPAESRSKPLLQGGGTLLVVDDESQLLSIYRRMLPMLGYGVVAASDGDEGLRLFRESPHRFVAVVTDHAMPNITGVELAQQVKGTRPHMPVVLCTGLDKANYQNALEKKWVDLILSKPVSCRRLAEELDGLLNSNRKKHDDSAW